MLKNNQTIIHGVLLEEKERNLLMQEQYKKEIELLPKGSIVKKINKSGEYFYLSYRNGANVISKYLGKDLDAINKINEKIEKRKHLKSIIKNLQLELKQIKKVVK